MCVGKDEGARAEGEGEEEAGGGQASPRVGGEREEEERDRDQGYSGGIQHVRDVKCLSRILIFVHPGSPPIPDPTAAPKEEGEIFFPLPFFAAKNIRYR